MDKNNTKWAHVTFIEYHKLSLNLTSHFFDYLKKKIIKKEVKLVNILNCRS